MYIIDKYMTLIYWAYVLSIETIRNAHYLWWFGGLGLGRFGLWPLWPETNGIKHLNGIWQSHKCSGNVNPS